MKNVIAWFGVVAPALIFLSAAGCGSGTTGGGTCTSNAVSVNTLDGTSGAAIDTRFDYTFLNDVDTSTVTTTTFFIRLAPEQTFTVPAGEYAYDATVCDVTRALTAAVYCARSTHCSLDPEADLEPATYYVICLTPAITYESGEAFESFAAEFVTAD